jgi:hypothetical protein
VADKPSEQAQSHRIKKKKEKGKKEKQQLLSSCISSTSPTAIASKQISSPVDSAVRLGPCELWPRPHAEPTEDSDPSSTRGAAFSIFLCGRRLRPPVLHRAHRATAMPAIGCSRCSLDPRRLPAARAAIRHRCPGHHRPHARAPPAIPSMGPCPCPQ